ncbi:TPA: hypothetical protein H7W28_004850, partial [Escherichia coli]|nr:hypothetical protein [Escherichia coli]
MIGGKSSKVVIVLSVLIGSSSGFASKYNLVDIPESFRDLWGEQDELLEVRLYGQSLGVHRIKSTPTTVAFESPDNLLDKIEINKGK